MNNDMIEIHNQNQKVNSTIEEILKIVKEIEEDTKDYKKVVHEAKPTEIKDLKTNEETDNIETLEGENLFL